MRQYLAMHTKMELTSEQKISLERKVHYIEGRVYQNLFLPIALRKAQAYAGENGYVATMSDLLFWRTHSTNRDLESCLFTALSEEVVGTTHQGNEVVVVTHGGGLLTSERIEQSYRKGLTSSYVARFTDAEMQGLLAGKCADGTEIPVFSYQDFVEKSNTPRRYSIVLDFDIVKNLPSDLQDADSFKSNPLFIARAGGEKIAAEFVDAIKVRYSVIPLTPQFVNSILKLLPRQFHSEIPQLTSHLTSTHILQLRNQHRFGSIDSRVPQGYVLYLDRINDGLNGHFNSCRDSRFVAVVASEVAREHVSTADLPAFEEEVTKLSEK